MPSKVDELLALYVTLTVSPNHVGIRKYASMYGRLTYAEQGDLAERISIAFGERQIG